MTGTDTQHTDLGAPIGRDAQPLAEVMWVDRNVLHANNYNPNHVAPPEMELLKISILSDGWTQPIVARPDGEIVDGFHRWTCSGDPRLAALTGGLVPVVYLSENTSTEHQMMSTVRHNRARGSHHVVRMADIVHTLQDAGMDEAAIVAGMKMEPEEVRRLLQRGSMRDRHGDGEFAKSFKFVNGNNETVAAANEIPSDAGER